MSQFKLVFISGSPSASSRSHRVLEAVANYVESSGTSTRLYSTRQFAPAALLSANTENPDVRRFIDDVVSSDGVVVATPVYKGTFSGTLKVLLDLIPPDALVDKVALGIATARISHHLAGAGAGLDGIFEFFRVRTRIAPLLFTDERLQAPEEPSRWSRGTLEAVANAATQLASSLVRR